MARKFKLEAIEWLQTSVAKNQRENEHIGEEFFHEADTLSEISSLIRESIQNSIDAKLDDKKPVRMIFKLGLQSAKNNKKYFAKLDPHARLSLNTDAWAKQWEPSNFLVIEDFNTRGLEGSIYQSRDIDKGKKYGDSFWFFEWATGQTNKLKGGRGSWGVGKIVFAAASQYKAYLVYSVRKSSSAPETGSDKILFGHSILKFATLNGERINPDRSWMVKDSHGNFIPSSDVQEIENFRSDWNVSRADHQLGTSIVIPYCKPDITVHALLHCIIQDYFMAVLDGNIECELIDDLGKKILLNAANLIDQISGIDESTWINSAKKKSELIGLCEMYKKKLSDQVETIRIEQPPISVNDWGSIFLAESDRLNFEAGIIEDKVFEFVVETKVPTKVRNEMQMDTFSVLISQSNVDFATKTVFSRHGILIPQANPESKLPGLLSIVLVEKRTGPSLEQFLRDAEGPAHKTWTGTGDRINLKYEKSGVRSCLRWVKSSVLNIFEILQPDIEEMDDRSLQRFFPFDEEENFGKSKGRPSDYEGKAGTKDGGAGGRGGRSRTSKPRVNVLPRSDFQGFILVANQDNPPEVGDQFKAEIGYTVSGGNSLATWSSEDFDLQSNFKASDTSGARVVIRENIVNFEILESDFKLVFEGFDGIRDISIDVDPVKVQNVN